MRKISFNKKYEKNIFDFKLINKENFILFKIKNFLDKENYKFIKKNFPKINEKDLVNFKLKKNKLKYSISCKDKKDLDILELNPKDILRSGEADYKENKLSQHDDEDETLIEFMIKYPKIIERPIVIKGNRGVIGRPPENVLKLF